MSMFVGEEDWRSEMIQKWECFYFDSMNIEKTNRVTFNETDEVHEFSSEYDTVSLEKTSKGRNRKRNGRIITRKTQDKQKRDLHQKILLQTVRKFRTTSWVVRVCMDFRSSSPDR